VEEGASEKGPGRQGNKGQKELLQCFFAQRERSCADKSQNTHQYAASDNPEKGVGSGKHMLFACCIFGDDYFLSLLVY
jgi:hypothetical protein